MTTACRARGIMAAVACGWHPEKLTMSRGISAAHLTSLRQCRLCGAQQSRARASSPGSLRSAFAGSGPDLLAGDGLSSLQDARSWRGQHNCGSLYRPPTMCLWHPGIRAKRGEAAWYCEKMVPRVRHGFGDCLATGAETARDDALLRIEPLTLDRRARADIDSRKDTTIHPH